MSEYKISKNEYNKEYRKKSWDMATGLQAVDDLKPSEYLLELSQKNIDGELTNEEIEELLYNRYKDETKESKVSRTKESDMVSNRIVSLLEEPAFTFSPVTLKYIHRRLFEDIYEHAGEFRTVNIWKKEPILGGETVKYANFQLIMDTYEYDFSVEKEKKYGEMTNEQVVKSLSDFTSSIWQVHPFMEGNTRSTAVFIERYLNAMSFDVDNTLFKDNSMYFRNALVRSNYADMKNRISAEDKYLRWFFDDLLFEGKHLLKNRDTILPAVQKQIISDRSKKEVR